MDQAGKIGLNNFRQWITFRGAGFCVTFDCVPAELLARPLSVIRKFVVRELAPDRVRSGLVAQLGLAQRLEVVDLLGRRASRRGAKLCERELLEKRQRSGISFFGVE